MNFPIFANPHHRRDYDGLTEKLWKARVWMRTQRIKRYAPPGIPALIEKSKRGSVSFFRKRGQR